MFTTNEQGRRRICNTKIKEVQAAVRIFQVVGLIVRERLARMARQNPRRSRQEAGSAHSNTACAAFLSFRFATAVSLNSGGADHGTVCDVDADQRGSAAPITALGKEKAGRSGGFGPRSRSRRARVWGCAVETPSIGIVPELERGRSHVRRTEEGRGQGGMLDRSTGIDRLPTTPDLLVN